MTLELHVAPTTREHPDYLMGGQEMVWQLDSFLWVPFEEECWHCGQPTTWVDIDFEARLHPGPCSERKWDEYRWAEMAAYLRSDEFRELVDRLREKMDEP